MLRARKTHDTNPDKVQYWRRLTTKNTCMWKQSWTGNSKSSGTLLELRQKKGRKGYGWQGQRHGYVHDLVFFNWTWFSRHMITLPCSRFLSNYRYQFRNQHHFCQFEQIGLRHWKYTAKEMNRFQIFALAHLFFFPLPFRLLPFRLLPFLPLPLPFFPFLPFFFFVKARRCSTFRQKYWSRMAAVICSWSSRASFSSRSLACCRSNMMPLYSTSSFAKRPSKSCNWAFSSSYAAWTSSNLSWWRKKERKKDKETNDKETGYCSVCMNIGILTIIKFFLNGFWGSVYYAMVFKIQWKPY